MTKKDLEAKIERLEKEIEALKKQPPIINHYHYHYAQPYVDWSPNVPPYTPSPINPIMTIPDFNLPSTTPITTYQRN